jgi:anti-sigma-K factor RskA
MDHGDASRNLDDYVDGRMDAGAARGVRAHVEGCSECRGEVERLSRLLERSRALPRSIAPPRDLWPAIAEGMGAPAPTAATFWTFRYHLAAAALVLMAASAAVTYVATRPDEAARLASDADTSGAATLVRLATTESEYGRAALELEEALDLARETLAPETVTIIERNLSIIDQAIAETRAALAADPTSQALRDVLSNRYRDRLDLLRHAGRLALRS